MKKLLLKLAHFILKKYGIIPLEMRDLVLFNDRVFEIQGWTISQDYFKTTATIEMCDCLQLLDKGVNVNVLEKD